MRIRRRNLAWLMILGALVAIGLLSGIASPAVSLLLLALWVGAAAASLIEVRPSALRDTVQRTSLTRMRMSTQAQEAVGRAARRGAYMPSDLTLLDVGLIVSTSNSEGMVMRRTRSFSKDDDGVRPFITLHVQPTAADRTAVIRFELLDHNGQQQYVHEMRTYLRDGEMNLLADHHLPLVGNDSLSGSGDGDLRVYVDGTLMGVLAYTLAPSVRERERQFSRESRLEDRPAEDEPMSLEDLLRGQQQGQNNTNRRG